MKKTLPGMLNVYTYRQSLHVQRLKTESLKKHIESIGIRSFLKLYNLQINMILMKKTTVQVYNLVRLFPINTFLIKISLLSFLGVFFFSIINIIKYIVHIAPFDKRHYTDEYFITFYPGPEYI